MTFRWLHLTDFHQGMSNQGWLWPNIRQQFLEDLPIQLEKRGPIHAVFFTGDLVQKGVEDEFKFFATEVQKILQVVSKNSSSPPRVYFVPGNHDLVRPTSDLDTATFYKKIYEDESICPDARGVIDEVFTNYMRFVTDEQSHLKQQSMLPGEFIDSIEIGGERIGIASLNTAALQLTEGDYNGKLGVHVRQLNALCDGDFPAWARKHRYCILLTHHPISWLSAGSQKHFGQEIRQYFNLHFHGHLHEGTQSIGLTPGGSPFMEIQARSLCGLETIAGTRILRSHGYVIREATIHQEKLVVRTWLRQAAERSDGWRFDVDTALPREVDCGTSPTTINLTRNSIPSSAPKRVAIIGTAVHPDRNVAICVAIRDVKALESAWAKLKAEIQADRGVDQETKSGIASESLRLFANPIVRAKVLNMISRISLAIYAVTSSKNGAKEYANIVACLSQQLTKKTDQPERLIIRPKLGSAARAANTKYKRQVVVDMEALTCVQLAEFLGDCLAHRSDDVQNTFRTLRSKFVRIYDEATKTGFGVDDQFP